MGKVKMGKKAIHTHTQNILKGETAFKVVCRRKERELKRHLNVPLGEPTKVLQMLAEIL